MIRPMETQAEKLRAKAEECKRQARKAVTATAMFTLLDIAADLLEKAKQADKEEKGPEQATPG